MPRRELRWTHWKNEAGGVEGTNWGRRQQRQGLKREKKKIEKERMQGKWKEVERVEVDNSRFELIHTHTNQPQPGRLAMVPRTNVLLGRCLENGAWVVIHTGLGFWSQFPLNQSYLREPPCPRIPPAKSLIFNWFWNQNGRALRKHRQRYASNLGYPRNGAPGQTHA